MAIQVIDGFRVNVSEYGKLLIIESDRLDECIQYAKDNHIYRIGVSRYDDYKFDNVNFLKENNFFKEVTIGDGEIDISAIHYLKDLKFLSLSSGKRPVDFTKFPHLTECSIDWNNKVTGLDVPNSIKRLTIWKFKPKSKDFGDLSGCNHVKHFHITESNVEVWDGIEKLQALEYLEAYYLRNITNVKGLEKLANLKTLILSNCPRLSNHEDDLKHLKQVEDLRLIDSANLKSLKFIKSLPRLKSIIFAGTNVVDGNITPTLELEYAAFDNKRHYSHKMKTYK